MLEIPPPLMQTRQEKWHANKSFGKIASVFLDAPVLSDVHLVDVCFGHFSDSVCQGVALNDLPEQIPFVLRKLFGIIDFLILVVVREDDCGGANRPGKTAATNFVAAAFHCWDGGEVGF